MVAHKLSGEGVQREQHAHPETASHDGHAECSWFVGHLGSRTGAWVGWGERSQPCRALSVLIYLAVIL